MNIRKCTQRAESPVINSVERCPTKGDWTCSQALSGLSGLDFDRNGEIVELATTELLNADFVNKTYLLKDGKGAETGSSTIRKMRYPTRGFHRDKRISEFTCRAQPVNRLSKTAIMPSGAITRSVMRLPTTSAVAGANGNSLRNRTG